MLEQKANLFDDLLFVPFEFGKMDCWILAREVFRRFGVDVPDYCPARQAVMKADYESGVIAELIADNLVEWEPIDEPEVPCLVTYSSAGLSHHVSVYIGKGKFIHTSKQLVYPAIERMDNPKYASKRFHRFSSSNGD